MDLQLEENQLEERVTTPGTTPMCCAEFGTVKFLIQCIPKFLRDL